MSTGKPLDIAMLSPAYWPEVRRGTERMLHDLSAHLAQDGHRIRLITSAPQRRPTHALEDGIRVLRLPRPPDRRFERRYFEQYVTHLPLSYVALRAYGADVAHAWFQTDALVAARWRRATGKPAVFSYMGVPDHPGLTLRRRRLDITVAAVQGVDAVVGVSRYVATQFERWLGVRDAHTIYPPIDLETFAPAPQLRTAEPSISCAAYADEPRKRIPLLIEAFALVRKEHPRARLLLQQPRDPRLAQQLSAPGVEWVDPGAGAAGLPALYGSSWVSALPSVGDAFGMVLAEALACGVPVVASNREALPEVVDRESIGRLFDGDEPRALAHALLDALELSADPATAAACRARAEEFSPQRCADAYRRLYEEVLER